MTPSVAALDPLQGRQGLENWDLEAAARRRGREPLLSEEALALLGGVGTSREHCLSCVRTGLCTRGRQILKLC